jgi:hypothetical protein
MKTLVLVVDTFFHLPKYKFGIVSKYKVEKWSVNE